LFRALWSKFTNLFTDTSKDNQEAEEELSPLVELAFDDFEAHDEGKGIELQNSKHINLYFISDDEHFKHLIQQLLDECWAVIFQKRIEKAEKDGKVEVKPRKGKHQKVILQRLIADLYLCNQTDPTRYIRYTRDNNSYSSRYMLKRIGRSHVTDIVDALCDMGYIESILGFHFSGNSASPIVRAEPKLIELTDQYKLRPNMFYESMEQEAIILKQAKVKADKQRGIKAEGAKPIGYDETGTVSKMRKSLNAYNSYLSENNIGLNITKEQFTALSVFPNRKPNMSATILKRVFNNSSFEQGGRFYGGWWITLPSQYRKHITINGKETIELDFKAMHIQIMYSKEGVDMPETDPYTFDELERDKVKTAMLTVINANSRADAVNSLSRRRVWPSKSKEEIGAILDIFESRHAPIANWFCSGKGVELQYIDSKVADIILTSMRDNHNCLALPIHDSFIVEVSKEGQLWHEMEQASLQVTGIHISIERKSPD